MAKDIKAQDFTTQIQQKPVKPEEINVTDETNYIIDCARNNDTRLVSIGPLIFFSTNTGDAWVLDPHENLALCLMQEGEEQTFVITETLKNFSIEWGASYQIDGDKFIVMSNAGRVSIRFDYPVQEILRTSGWVKK